MRGILVRGALAITTLIALSFILPLAMTVRAAAHRGAEAAADARATTVALAMGGDLRPAAVEKVLEQERAEYEERNGPEQPQRVSVRLPDGGQIGSTFLTDEQVSEARNGDPAVVETRGGHVVLRPVDVKGEGKVLIEVYIPDSEYDGALLTNWLLLAGVGVGLVITSAVVTDRLASRLVGTMRDLASRANALGAGDLTERVQIDGPRELQDVGAAFNALADRTARMLDDEREFAADVSHRLRTPLTALRLLAARLPNGRESDQVRDAVVAMEREVDHLIRVASAGRPEPTPSRTDLRAVVVERLRFWSALAEDEGRRMVWDVTPHPAPIRMAASDVTGSVDALIGNVFRHTRAGIPLAVRLARDLDPYADPPTVTLVVEDGGPGLRWRANRTENGPEATARRVGSTGLGLRLIERRVGAAGGTMTVDRGGLGGARLSIRLPLWQPDPIPGRRARRMALRQAPPWDRLRSRLSRRPPAPGSPVAGDSESAESAESASR